MKYVEVAVDAPLGFDRALTYSVPTNVHVVPGQMVWVPLGKRPVQGVVFKVSDDSQVTTPREIISTIDPAPLVSEHGLELASWISRYYLAPLFDSVSLMLPPGFKNRVDTYLEPMPDSLGRLPDSEIEVWNYVSRRGRVPDKEINRLFGRNIQGSIMRLIRRGFIRRTCEIPLPKAVPSYDQYLMPNLCDIGEGKEVSFLLRHAPKQARLLADVVRMGKHIMMSDANKNYGRSVVEGLLRKGLLAQEWIRQDQVQDVMVNGIWEKRVLTTEQDAVVSYLDTVFENDQILPRSVLLHGITGSGKTEVYIRAVENCVNRGRQAIVLVPEISLTPQMSNQLKARFPGKVVVVHSGLSLKEQFNCWWRIKVGQYAVVVGPRSALFSPLQSLGLIVVDEEHEWTYKEQERAPRFHTREVALKLADLMNIPVIMGSATPDVGTFYETGRGRHKFFKLSHRIGTSLDCSQPFGTSAGLPNVAICDMREELKAGNRSPFSDVLKKAIKECVGRDEQAILFLNRRGSATLVQCRDCGFTLRCGRCAVTVTYHRSKGMQCHLCNRRTKIPTRCPGCYSSRIRYLGLGTERISEALAELVPGVRVMRWDSDAVRESDGHDDLLRAFSNGEAQILVGTQMVAKGLHIPKVSLVGVVLADVGLHLPDFRAGERTFQLLCQVAGRAGRGSILGKVIIQTYSPSNYAIQAARQQDYENLYEREIQYRAELGNPPFSRLVHMVYIHTNESACRREAYRIAKLLRDTAYGRGLVGIDVVGPAPAHAQKVRGRYRWHLIIRGRSLHSLINEVTIPKGWTIDVDPVTVL